MSSVERIYALFIEANPVPDPETMVLDDVDAEPDLWLAPGDDLASEVEPGTMRAGRRFDPRLGWRPAVAAVMVVFALAAVVFGASRLLIAGDEVAAAEEAVLNVVFDGEACHFSGTERLLEGTVEVTAQRAAGVEPVAVLVAELIDDTIGMEELEAWAAEHSAEMTPDFVAPEIWIFETLADDDLSVTFPARLRPGRYVITCNTAPRGRDRAHPAAIVTVLPQ